jgi:hypothetical protein
MRTRSPRRPKMLGHWRIDFRTLTRKSSVPSKNVIGSGALGIRNITCSRSIRGSFPNVTGVDYAKEEEGREKQGKRKREKESVEKKHEKDANKIII